MLDSFNKVWIAMLEYLSCLIFNFDKKKEKCTRQIFINGLRFVSVLVYKIPLSTGSEKMPVLNLLTSNIPIFCLIKKF